ncbi:nuclear transport factor 2 family protein [Pseudomonas sp.]|uniref:YybH family protein n=1 Tax=Pseudomonas sp. TaxID=306 RepID=UPI0026370D2C|nr:nuclear transport factor 2 family protein [Pseudomonas sp.]
MLADSPQALHELFVAHANKGDVERLLGLYEAKASYVAPDGAQLDGAGAIRDLLEQLLASRPTFSNETNYVIEAANLALMSNTWCAQIIPPEGDAIELTGTSIEVARRQPDGGWLYVIDAPASLS